MKDRSRLGYRYEDLFVGMRFRSPGRTILDADLIGFAGLTGDYSELHTSDVYAKASQFGRRVAHGMLGLAYAHGLMWARTGELRETAVAFLGIEDWRFLGPIFVGDTIFVDYVLAELRDSRSRPSQAIAIFEVAVVNQDGAIVQRGRKALLVSKVPLEALAASAARAHPNPCVRLTMSDVTTRSGVPITIRHVSKMFGEDTDTPFRALKEVNATIPAGEFVSIVGASGCGKSTLMLMVAGLLKRSTGDILVGGRPVTRPITDVGIAFQDHLLLDFRTAFENVMLHADIRGLDRNVIAKRAQRAVRAAAPRARDGQVPAAALGRHAPAGLADPHARARPVRLLMDEPFGALDALTRLQVRTDLEALWLRRRPTVLFITHSVEEAVGLSDRILVMSPSPGEVVDDIEVDLPRPRPIMLGDAPEFGAYVDRIHRHFERMGILHGFTPKIAA